MKLWRCSRYKIQVSYNKFRSSEISEAFSAHRATCIRCFKMSAGDVLTARDSFCIEGAAIALAWCEAFEKETPEGSTYKLGLPAGSQPYKMAESDDKKA